MPDIRHLDRCSGIISFLRKRDSPWAIPALYALGASALISVALAAGAIWSIRPMVSLAFPSITTPGNVRERVKEWLDHAKFMSAPAATEKSETYFTLRVRFGNDHEVLVERPKSDGQSLLLTARVFLSEQDRSIVEQGQRNRVETLANHLRMELARLNMTYSNVQQPFNNMILEKRLPIPGLDEYVFRNSLEQMDFGIILVIGTVDDELRSWRKTP